jgi:hypothetical protein
MELIPVPLGIVVAALLVVGAVTGAAFKFVWFALKIIFALLFWWLLLHIRNTRTNYLAPQARFPPPLPETLFQSWQSRLTEYVKTS